MEAGEIIAVYVNRITGVFCVALYMLCRVKGFLPLISPIAPLLLEVSKLVQYCLLSLLEKVE